MLQLIRKVHERCTSLLNKGAGSIPDRSLFRTKSMSGTDDQTAAGAGSGRKVA